MSKGKNRSGGSSHDRRCGRRHDEPAAPRPAVSAKAHDEGKTAPPEPIRAAEPESAQRRNDLFALIGIGLTFLSWGSTTLPGQTSPWLGSALLCAAAISILYGLWRVWKFGRIRFAVPALVMAVATVTLGWFGIVRPQRGKPFQDLLVEGYHLTNECESIPGSTEMPRWMRDQSQGWQSRVLQLVEQRLNAADAETWEKAVVIGTVNDVNSDAYQCLWLGNKVAALEKIVATEFEPKLKHRNSIGPTYWLNAVNGEVDVTEMFKSGNREARVYVNGGGTGMIKVTGHIPGVQNGTIKFQLDPP
jgi:hypothetical protein